MAETKTLPNLETTDIEEKAKRDYKDTLFRYIFKGEDDRSKRWLLSLYNALNDSNYTDINDLKITTIQNALFLTMKDDLSFLIDGEMNLFEHQSTVNPNMPLRGLMYFARLYQSYLAGRKQMLYGSSQVKIPAPKFVVFYNGTTNQEDIIKYRLSDAFEKPTTEGEFEWTATVLNVNANHNPALQKKCKALYDYSNFVANVRKRIADGQERDEAVKAAVDDAINNKLLDGLFEEQKWEIIGLMLAEFDQEIYEKTVREEGRAEGLAKGLVEGAQQKAIEAAINLLKMKLGTVEQIAQAQGLTVEKVQELKTQLEAEKK
ncbi:hypothetical protein MSI_18410 [Treponema sp. JC4]|uniref:hypothetical protein n=1 Tax=Treponema sp. JC4 TaxID=1124982 RepID=UPI00025B0AB7|nr:hypothetical protein [Treponema sp. JC4]EID84699.1 hypothetical protein MSI_18410 [Treponema sp. JC4]